MLITAAILFADPLNQSKRSNIVTKYMNNLTKKKVVVDLDGGQLEINWQSDGVWMTGETAHSFDGHLTEEFLKI